LSIRIVEMPEYHRQLGNNRVGLKLLFMQQRDSIHNNRKLFRGQAIETQKQKLYGNVLLVRPVSFRFLTIATVILAIGIVVFFFQFGFTRKETVIGVLAPQDGLARVYSAQTGLLVQRNVRDGQSVNKGDVLFVLSSDVISNRGATQNNVGFLMRSRIASLNKELAQLTAQGASQQEANTRRTGDLAKQINKLEQEIALQRKRVAMAEASAARFQNLRLSQFTSDAQVQDKQAEVIDQQTRLAGLERTAVSLRSELAVLANERNQHALNAQRQAEQLTREIAEVEEGDTVNEAHRQFIVHAPKAGVVTAITVEPGQLIAPNLAMATIVPASGELEAELYAPSRAIGFISQGTKVLLRYQAFPYQKFGQYKGVVREISRSPLQANEIAAPLASPATSKEPLYRIRVKLDRQQVNAYAKPAALQPGMQLEASLVLEHRKLVEWIIDPIYTLTGRL
jgi:membrane fusion protein